MDILGKKISKGHSPFAVKKMWVTFPAEDGNYTGYKDDDTGDDDDNALMAS